MRGVARLKRWFRRAVAPLRPGAVILLYHRVAKVPSDPQLLCVRPQHFAEHLTVLRESYTVLGLEGLHQRLEEGQLPRRAVVITFDDGYADNFYRARSLLEEYETPATMFITTGYIGGDREFWWDEVERIFLQPGRLPETLRLRINGRTYEWNLGTTALYSEEEYRRWRGWSVNVREVPTPRHHVYRSLCDLLRPLGGAEREQILGTLRLWAGEGGEGRSSHRILSPEEIVALSRSDLVDIGAHTVTHPLLSALPPSEQAREIGQSKAHLEEILGHEVRTFSYPYGSRSAYTEATVALVREAGFVFACSNFPGVVRRRTNSFELPRMLVRDWDGEEFARKLRGFFHGSP